MQKFHSLVIKKICKETPNSFSLLFDIPSEIRKFFVFKSGQYTTIKCTINGKEVRRCYSISSVPTETDFIKIVIKLIPNGIFSTYVTEELKVGDKLELSVPEGNFHYEPLGKDSKKIVAIAAGSGITPIFSIIKTILHESNDKITLFYGNKSITDAIFYIELQQLSNDFKERFELINFYSEEKVPECYFGRINQKVIIETLKNDHDFLAIEKFYICGPESLIKSTTQTLLELNISEEKILHELFFLPESEKIGEVLQEEIGDSSITIILDGKEETITINKNIPILDSLLNAGFDVPYSCQNAICSACICKLTKGEIKMLKNEVLSEAEINEKMVLTCQSYPISDEIELNYDIL